MEQQTAGASLPPLLLQPSPLPPPPPSWWFKPRMSVHNTSPSLLLRTALWLSLRSLVSTLVNFHIPLSSCPKLSGDGQRENPSSADKKNLNILQELRIFKSQKCKMTVSVINMDDMKLRHRISIKPRWSTSQHWSIHSFEAPEVQEDLRFSRT